MRLILIGVDERVYSKPSYCSGIEIHLMAIRPVFIPNRGSSEAPGVLVKNIEFHWYPGMSKSQKQKSVASLHTAAGETGIGNILEVSSKSTIELGINLSAFNLQITTKKYEKVFSVESAFQSSKVFNGGGPFVDLLDASSKDAKRDPRLKESGDLLHFSFFNTHFDLEPRTFFYDWIYVNALNQNKVLGEELYSYDAFTDIEFNPNKSINCQAYSASIYLSLSESGLLKDALQSPEALAECLKEEYAIRNESIQFQNGLFS
jgi:hypothetical protein